MGHKVEVMEAPFCEALALASTRCRDAPNNAFAQSPEGPYLQHHYGALRAAGDAGPDE